MTTPISERLDDLDEARDSGRRKMDWALQHMPILQELREQFESEQPLAGEVVGMAMHVEAKTATSRNPRGRWRGSRHHRL